jgi:hypothetical protein
MRPDLDSVRLEMTLYFQRNPFARETAESLALRLSRPATLVEPVLSRLVEQTILECQGTLYRYRRPYVASWSGLDQEAR